MNTRFTESSVRSLFTYNDAAVWYHRDPLMCLPGKFFVIVDMDDDAMRFAGMSHGDLQFHAVMDDFGNLVRTA